jgi:hypothetical protein
VTRRLQVSVIGTGASQADELSRRAHLLLALERKHLSAPVLEITSAQTQLIRHHAHSDARVIIGS